MSGAAPAGSLISSLNLDDTEIWFTSYYMAPEVKPILCQWRSSNKHFLHFLAVVAY